MRIGRLMIRFYRTTMPPPRWVGLHLSWRLKEGKA